jgi:uncharacterized protein YutE (UPF0331/DUF86 family)
MVMETEKNEADILRTLRGRYEQRGYTFVAHPTDDLVPEFLRGYRPDALALSEKGSVIIEIKTTRNRASEKSLALIAERVAQHPDWKFEIYYAGDFPRPAYETPNVAAISQLLQEVQSLQRAGFDRAAVVMGWAALEAIARAVRSDGVGRSAPMIPSEIVEWLARTGYIDSPTSRILRQMIRKRDAIVHGDQTADLQTGELLVLISTLQLLAQELERKSTD